MNYKKIVLSLALSFFAIAVNSQKTAQDNISTKDYEKGLALYKSRAFKPALYLFEKAKEKNNVQLQENLDYYIALSSIKLNYKNGDALMENFIANHPTSNKKNTAILEVGNHFYTHGKPAASLKWFQKASPKYMTRKQEEAYNFKMAYALFSNKKYTDAKEYFLPLSKSEKFGTDANYYLGYISYLQKDYNTAQQYFGSINHTNKFDKEITYYLLNINFKQKKYQAVVDGGKSLLEKVSKKEVSEISKIIGESYFYLKKYENAISYLKKYRGKKNRLNTTDHYFLGYAYYQLKDYNNAIVTFNKITKGKDKIAQNAFYHLADAYLKTGKKTEALNAFKSCSELDFDADIKEDAWYNYAKLSYDIGNPYKNTPEVLQAFVSNYPKSSKSKEVTKLIVNSFINTNNFEGALNYYSKHHLSKNAAFQKISLYRGFQLFQEGQYQESLKHFKTSSNQVFDKTIQAQAMYWEAETQYRLNSYKLALANFKRFEKNSNAKKTKEYKNINYAIGYTYFKLRSYEKAENYFEKNIRVYTKNKTKLYDSYIRLGDCHFISKSYWNAMEAYNKVIKSRAIDDDYAQFQKALCYGFVNRNERKIETLVSFSKQHPKSSYKDDALFELGNAYINQKQSANAINAFENLIKNHNRSVYIPKALLKQGLILFNENNPMEAINKYKLIVKKYPNSKNAKQAINNARQVYVDIDKVDEYAIWVKSIDFASISDSELDNTMYEAAEKQYLENNLNKAISSFKKYLINFPKGQHVLKANFYSAEANFSTKAIEKSTPFYQFVIDASSNEYTEASLSRLAQIYLDSNSWDLAIPILKRLELEANFPQNILFAQSNLMKGMYEKEDFENAVAYAEKVLENKKTETKVKSDAHVFIARSAIKTNKLTKAKKAYQEVSKIASGALKAEALYYDAFFKNKEKAYEASNKKIQTLAADYASYKHWGVKGLILMAKNNHGLNDVFQATYILESVIKNYPQFKELIAEAKILLAEINKEQESKTENPSANF